MKFYIVTLVFLFTSTCFSKSVDLRKYQTSVKNQKDRNTCAYFATTALIEMTLKKKFNRDFDISEQFQIFYGKDFFNEYVDVEFGDNYSIAKNFEKQGFFYKEADIPYQLSYFEPGRPCEKEDPFNTNTPSFCFSQGEIETKNFKKVKFDGLKAKWITGLWSGGKSKSQLFISEINNERSVVVTLKVYAPLWKNSHVTFPDEVNSECESGKKACYGHAILLTGYDDVKKVFFFKNSWGTKWGDKGYGSVSFDYVDKHSDMPMTAYFDRFLADLRE